MKRNWRTLLVPYQKALKLYLKKESASRLRPALALGHRAVAMGLETLDLAMIHEHALLDQIVEKDSPATRIRLITKARRFFAESIVAMEETHRSAVESNLHLSRLNQSLSQRTVELAASNRQLIKEIARRKVVENNLRQSEQHSTQLLKQSQKLQEQMRLLSRRILSVQEEERKRISRELHDVIAQMLTGINVRLATLKLDALANNKGLGKKIHRTQRLVEKSVDIVHRFARELRPAALDDLGLISALHSLATKFSRETGIRVHMTAFAEVNNLENNKRTALYRVAQEALTNINRHADASRVDVNIRLHSNFVRMTIKDDGCSFNVQKAMQSKVIKRLGLLGMRERVEMVGGTLSIESAPGSGTTIRADIPFKHQSKVDVRP